ncbi:MAG: prepilin peptidase [Comamonas sp.]
MDLIALSAIWLFLLIAAYSDFTNRRISNLIIILIFSVGFLWVFLNGCDDLVDRLKASSFGFAIGMIFYGMKLMGAADVKLVPALGIVGGSWVLAVSWLISVPLVIAAGIYLRTAKKNSCHSRSIRDARRIVPFGGIWIICFLVVWIYVKASAYEI